MSIKVHELQPGNMFTVDSGESWHLFERFGKSILPGHVIIVTRSCNGGSGPLFLRKPSDGAMLK
jgi:hypothetical protein